MDQTNQSVDKKKKHGKKQAASSRQKALVHDDACKVSSTLMVGSCRGERLGLQGAAGGKGKVGGKCEFPNTAALVHTPEPRKTVF